MSIRYYKEPIPEQDHGGNTLWLFSALVSMPGGYSARASGTSPHEAYIRALDLVRTAEAQGQVTKQELSELLDERHYPPAERFIRMRDGSRMKTMTEDPERASACRKLIREHGDAVYRAAAELCIQNGGDPDRPVWWHNGETMEPWGDEAAVCIPEAAKIVHAFMKGGGTILIDADEYRALLRAAGKQA